MSYKFYLDMNEPEILLLGNWGVKNMSYKFFLDIMKPTSPVWLKKCHIRLKSYTTYS